jgi:hypothetical protein
MSTTPCGLMRRTSSVRWACLLSWAFYEYSGVSGIFIALCAFRCETSYHHPFMNAIVCLVLLVRFTPYCVPFIYREPIAMSNLTVVSAKAAPTPWLKWGQLRFPSFLPSF